MKMGALFDTDHHNDFSAMLIAGIMSNQDLAPAVFEWIRSLTRDEELRALISGAMVRNIIAHVAAPGV
jgi:hypothetical protein